MSKARPIFDMSKATPIGGSAEESADAPEQEVPDAVAQSRASIASRVQPNNLMNVLAGKPLTGMESGLSSPAQTPENAEAMATGAAIGAPIEGLAVGGARAIPAIARSLVGATAGSAIGGYGGKEVGGLVGHPEAGAKVGAAIGGLAGGYTGARGGAVPTKNAFLNKIMGLEEAAPEYVLASKSPGPYRGPKSVPKPVTPQPELGSPENPAYSSKLPTGRNSMPKPEKPVRQPIAEVQSAEGVPGSLPKPSGRLVLLPEEASATEQLNTIAKKRASEHGMQYAAGMRPAGGGRVPLTPTKTFTPEAPVPKGNVTPFPTAPGVKLQTDGLGLKWAIADDGVRVTIPRGIPDSQALEYAGPELEKQRQGIQNLPWMKKQQ
jgi:hypothetical protein